MGVSCSCLMWHLKILRYLTLLLVIYLFMQVGADRHRGSHRWLHHCVGHHTCLHSIYHSYSYEIPKWCELLSPDGAAKTRRHFILPYIKRSALTHYFTWYFLSLLCPGNPLIARPQFYQVSHRSSGHGVPYRGHVLGASYLISGNDSSYCRPSIFSHLAWWAHALALFDAPFVVKEWCFWSCYAYTFWTIQSAVQWCWASLHKVGRQLQFLSQLVIIGYPFSPHYTCVSGSIVIGIVVTVILKIGLCKFFMKFAFAG